MKFARYLEETQVPEWKRAYIDYRGLKKCITAIRKARDADGSHIPAEPQIQIASVTTRSSQDGDLQPVLESPTNSTHPFPNVQEDGKAKVEHVEEEHRPHSPPHVDPENGPVQFPPATSTIQGRPRIEYNEDVQRSGGPSQKPESTREQSRDNNTHVNGSARSGRSVAISDLTDGHDADVEGEEGDGVARVRPDLPRSTTVNMGVLPLFRRSTGRSLSLHRNNKGRWELGRAIENHWDLNQSVPLAELMPQLTNKQKEFFEKLDSELDKVETFYVEREKEMKSKTHAIKMQLHELQEHRKRFHEAQAQHYWLPFSLIRRNAPVVAEHPRLPHQARKRRKFRSERSVSASRSQSRDPNQTDGIEGAETEGGEGESPESAGSSDTMTNKKRPGNVDIAAERGMATGVGRGKRSRRESKEGEHLTMRLEPEDYLHAKKKLKKALLECYRGLEVLNNYRTLNVIGFRKALKKFEKVTKIPAQQAYFAEKIEPNAFYSSRTVESLLHETEELFAARFTRGDKKRAQMRLRGGSDSRSHHISTFLAGLMIGFAVPAFVDAVYLSFQADTRAAIPGWDGLLFVYSIFLVPVVFSLLVGLNLAVWSIARINYVFIFELDLRTRIDYRQYFMLPSFLLSTLCYAFWLSFARIGAGNVSPTLWPLLWLAMTGAVLLDPLPVLFKPSRWWLIRNVLRLLTSGTHHVEFADFWMGDQFCSLVFTLSNFYFIGCVYANGLDQTWQRCNQSHNRNWAVPWILGSLPLLIRAVQSVKRWVDSRLITHLINGGKYTAGILYYLFYYNWRHQGGGYGGSFAVWCVFGVIYSTYAATWDLLMDWSLLRPHVIHPLLRANLLYQNHTYLYYFAIITNVLIRFIWVFYIPASGPNFIIRTFIAAMLEILRRWQWNFYRLENEHLGNMDQYRVTREVPLPYSFEDPSRYSDDDEDHERRSVGSLAWRRNTRTPIHTTESRDSSD